MGVIPATLNIAARILRDKTRERALAEAQVLVQLCRQIAPTTHEPAFWTIAADAIDRAYVQRHTYEQLMNWYRSFNQPASPSLNTLAYLCATAQAEPEEALGNTLLIMPTLCGFYPHRSLTYRRLLLPFVEGYWVHAFEQMRFYFRSPDLVSQLLREARALPEDQRLRGIIRAVHTGFIAPLPREIRQWLDGSR